MKKINFYGLLLMLALVTTLGFASCSSDDDSGNEATSETSLIGTWTAVKGEFVLKEDGNVVQNFTDTELHTTFVFNSDGTFECVPGGRWTLDGSELTLDYSTSYEADYEHYNVAFEGGKLVLSQIEKYEEDGHSYERNVRCIFTKINADINSFKANIVGNWKQVYSGDNGIDLFFEFTSTGLSNRKCLNNGHVTSEISLRYEVDGSKLIFKELENNNTEEYKIVKLTANDMIISFDGDLAFFERN